MAIDYFASIDLNKNELQNAVLQNESSITGAVEGQIYYDTDDNQVKVCTHASNGSFEALVFEGANDLFTGLSAVTPASGDSFLTLDSDGSTEQMTTVSALQTYMQNNLTFTADTNLTEEEVEDFVGGMVTGNTETGITVTYEDSDGTLDFVIADSDFALTGDVTGTQTQTAKGNVSIATTIASGAVHHGMLNDDIISGQGELSSGLASTDELMISDAGTVKRMDVSVLQSYLQSNLTFTSNTDVDVSNANLLSRLAALESSGGAANENITIGADSGDTIVITGNLQVSGTTTTVNSTTVNLNDHNIVLDSGNSTSAVVDGAGITIEGGTGDDATMTYNASTNAFDFKLGSSFENIKADGITGTILTASQTNITGVGTISTGVWQGTAIASAYLDADTAHLSGVQTFTGSKTFQTAIFTHAETDEAGLISIQEAADNGTHAIQLTVPASLTNSNTTITIPYTGGSAYMAAFAADPGTSTITSTPAELNLLDGVSGLVQADFTKLAAVDATATELNMLDAGTSGSSVTLADGDSIIIGDASASNETKKVLMSDIATYIGAEGTNTFAVDLETNQGTVAASGGNAKLITVTHSLSSLDVMVTIVEKSTGATVFMDVLRNHVDTITIETSGDNWPASSAAYRVLIQKIV